MDLIATALVWPKEGMRAAVIAGLLISAVVYSAHRVWARRRGAPVRAHTPPADLPEKRQVAKERAPGGECRNSLASFVFAPYARCRMLTRP